jgi:hypothetical protein
MKKISNKPFSDWKYEEVNKVFGLKRLSSIPALDELSNIHLPANHVHRTLIDTYRMESLELIDGWNEDEYKFLFISPFLKLVNFYSTYYSVFTQRPLSIQYDNGTKLTQGNVEWMLAQGRQIPENPHFFLHEYKPEKRRDNDPLGQLLIAMVAAQAINADDQTIYGIYVNGRNWFFVALVGKTYSVGNPYVSTSNDIFDLFAVLEFLRDKMEHLYQKLV